MRHPFSASERRGILVVALVALAVTGAGLIVPRCSGNSSRIETSDVQILMDSRSDGLNASDSVDTERKGRKKSRKKSSDKKRSIKKHSYRSPLDENPL